MKPGIKVVCCTLLLCMQAVSAVELDKPTVESAKRFLAAYLEHTNKANITLLTLYSESAKITATVTTLDRSTSERQLSGHQWKQLLRDTWYSGQPSVEPIELHDVIITRLDENRLKIAARRYAMRRCYWDNNYLAVIEKATGGGYQIVSENLLIDHQNQCVQPDTTNIKQEIKIVPN
ncbi:hypothetical protein A1353_19015 [Methylomonas methanica]|uniref:SnoaL-like domain-containing protein n=1 Tax=Methylomonas methanica TaxID=421 RepID=A0A177M5E2_METMH|nr:hypothetical protein [Methylomonas methanica]OAI00902.1 hypothetical protein A1353_19015 [Methylomonas methanica]